MSFHAEPMRMPDHQMQARQPRHFRRQRRQCLGTRLHEGRAQQQVFGRVAGERELGRQHHACTLRMRLPRGLRQQARIAGQVAHRGVDLRDGHFHDA